MTMTDSPTPGVYDGIPEADYHGDKDSLSVSGAKKLLPPSCPARFKWELENGQQHKAVFDFGSAAHKAVLGVGADVAIIRHDSYRTTAARAERDDAYARGAIPVLEEEAKRVDGMVQALKAHPTAAALLDPAKGKPEQSAYRIDPDTGTRLRCRFDWLPDSDGGRLVIPDYKTAASAEPGAFSRSAATFGYHMQAAWYADMAEHLGLAEDASFVFIVQEKVAPYLVSVVELDSEAVDTGRRRYREAIDLYAECKRNDVWPSYTAGVELISLPAWATYDIEMDIA